MERKIFYPLMGMDTDSAVNRRDEKTIYKAENLRFSQNEDGKSGVLTNINGGKKVIEFPSSNWVVKQSLVIADKLILFAYETTGDDYILAINISDLTNSITIDTVNYHYNGGNRIISGNIGFKTSDYIDALGYIEGDSIHKVYWAIKNISLRSINIIKSDKYDYSVYDQNIGGLDLLSSADLSAPIIDESKTGNGSLTTGKIAYVYQLSNTNGGISSFSPLSFATNLTRSSDFSATDRDYKGYGLDVDTGKSIHVSISGNESSFSRINLYSVHYTQAESIPLVKLIYSGPYGEGFVFQDTGNAISDIAPEELEILETFLINSRSIDVKNMYLFSANIEDDYFDIDKLAGGLWDARAYRFNSNGQSYLYEKNLNNKIIIYDSNPNYESIPEEHDCINIYNDNSRLSDNMDNTIVFNRQIDGITLGANGINVQITESTTDYSTVEDTRNEAYIKESIRDGNGYKSYSNSKYSRERKSFIPFEVYRLGIQFQDSKGRLSYVKWICDYRINANDYFASKEDSIEMKSINTFLDFNISNIPTDNYGEVLKYRIMYVPIDDSNTGVYWGMFNKIFKFSDGKHRSLQLNMGPISVYWGPSSNINFQKYGRDIYFEFIKSIIGSREIPEGNNRYLEFISPDYCFGKNVNFSKIFIKSKIFNLANIGNANPKQPFNDYRERISSNSSFQYAPYKSIISNKAYKAESLTFDASQKSYYNIDDIFNFSYSSEQEDFKLSGSDLYSRIHLVFNSNEIDRVFTTATGNTDPAGQAGAMALRVIGFGYGTANKGRCQFIHLSEDFNPDIQTNNLLNHSFIGCGLKEDFLSKYGGPSYGARKLNSYVSLQEKFNKSTVRGDSFITSFEHLRLIAQNNYGPVYNTSDVRDVTWRYTGFPEVIHIPVISRINCNLRSDTSMTKNLNNTNYLMQENAGVFQDFSLLFLAYNTSYPTHAQDTDMYLYNDAYSAIENIRTYSEKPIGTSFEERLTNRIIVSRKKILGEKEDSFLKANVNSYIDVDGRYGEISKILSFNDRLYFFQEKAIGIASVNEKSMTNVSDGSSIVLGELGLLSRYDYLTTNNGVSKINHVGYSDNYIYCIDIVNKEIIRIGNQVELLSVLKNVSSLIKSFNLENSIIFYNKEYNEVNFTLDNGKSLVFNEKYDCFVSINDLPKISTGNIRTGGSQIGQSLLSNTTKNNNITFDAEGNGFLLNEGNKNLFNGENSSNTIDGYIPSKITYLLTANANNQVLFNVLELIANCNDNTRNASDIIDSIRVYSKNQDTGYLNFEDVTKYKFGKHRFNKFRNYTVSSKERILSDHIYVEITTNSNYNESNGTYYPNNYNVYFSDLIMTFQNYNYFV